MLLYSTSLTIFLVSMKLYRLRKFEIVLDLIEQPYHVLGTHARRQPAMLNFRSAKELSRNKKIRDT